VPSPIPSQIPYTLFDIYNFTWCGCSLTSCPLPGYVLDNTRIQQDGHTNIYFTIKGYSKTDIPISTLAA